MTRDLFQDEADQLEALGQRFMAAIEARQKGDVDKAEDMFRSILKLEPRLPEPRLELARILLDTDRLEEAEEQARTGLENLESVGAWTDELPENVVLAMAHALLAETLRRHADEDDVIFGDPAKFKAIVAEAKTHFEAASRLDPSDEYASWNAFFLGVAGHGGKVAKEDEN